MNNLSDIIEQYIISMLKDTEQDIIEIQRNILADQFHCVPSQINYVLSTRFNIEKGYVVESRRGGGGFVRIYRVPADNINHLLKSIYSLIGAQISQPKAAGIIARLAEDEIISRREASIMAAVISRDVLSGKGSEADDVRAKIMKAFIEVLYKQM